MKRWLAGLGLTVVLWFVAGWVGARMGGVDVSIRPVRAGEVAPVPAPTAWVGLYPPDFFVPPVTGRRVSVLPLHTGPTVAAPSAGRIRVTLDPEGGLRSAWLPPEEGDPVPFSPDLHDPDWESGPWHHQSVLAVQGRWFLLPAGPFPTPVWVDLSGFVSPPAVVEISPGMILRSPEGDVTVLRVQGEGVEVRPEQPADQWCDAGHAPAVSGAADPFLLRGGQLREPGGRLRVTVKYTRGC
jgi:hypothetical protein